MAPKNLDKAVCYEIQIVQWKCIFVTVEKFTEKLKLTLVIEQVSTKHCQLQS